MRIAVFGATGYGGIETLKLLVHRKDVEVVWIGSDKQEGKKLVDVIPMFRNTRYASLGFSSQQGELPDVDFALLATPHGFARSIVPNLLEHRVRVIDFSGDYRLPDKVYEKWYNKAVTSDSNNSNAVYGLPELNREVIKEANLIANPGCYATTANLALMPAVEMDLVDVEHLVVDAKSGVSGAGRNPQLTTHFVEVSESYKAYKVGAHQHTPEIEQTLQEARRRRRWGESVEQHEQVRILMTTQLLPIKRGIYVTAYGQLKKSMSASEVFEIYQERYANEPFVTVLPLGEVPEIRQISGTNQCHLSVHVDDRTETLLVMATLDNLLKGAAGQAIQNLNLMSGTEEATGLSGMAWW